MSACPNPEPVGFGRQFISDVQKFADGAASIDGSLIPIQKLDVYSDGFAAECANTDDGKLISDEILRWAQSSLGFREFSRPPREIFQSQVTVEFDPGIENIFKTWKRIQGIMNARVQERYGFSQNVDVYRLEWRGPARQHAIPACPPTPEDASRC
jgi:hypothetical protein